VPSERCSIEEQSIEDDNVMPKHVGAATHD
jgi:hypothetical protein